MTELEFILENFPSMHMIVSEMKNAEHSATGKINPYHAEGDVWTHTMMVYDYALKHEFSPNTRWAALLHDIGKPYVREEVISKKHGLVARFRNHEAWSFYMAIDILKKADLSHIEIAQIAEMIARHSELYEWESKNESYAIAKSWRYNFTHFTDFINLVRSDVYGRISDMDYQEFDRKCDQVIHEFLNETHVHDNVDTPTAYLMVGPPAVGKTTCIKKVFSEFTVISRDDILTTMYPSDDYSESWATADQNKVNNEFTKQVRQAWKSGDHFVVDTTNMTRKRRRAFTTEAHKNGFNVVAVVMMTGYDEIISRNSLRKGKTLNEEIIDRMISSFTFPVAGIDVDNVMFSS